MNTIIRKAGYRTIGVPLHGFVFENVKRVETCKVYLKSKEYVNYYVSKNYQFS